MAASLVWRGTDVLVRRRPRMWPVIAAAIAAFAIPTLAGIYLLSTFVALIEVLLLFFLPAILYEDSFRGERRVAGVQADAEGLHFGKSLVLPRKRIDACAIEPLPDGMCNVQLWGSGRRDDISLLVPEERARLLLDALGLKNDRHAARFLVESSPLRAPGTARLIRLAILLGAALLVAGVILLTLQSEWVGFTLVPLMFAYFGIVRRLRRRRTITLGGDALTVRNAIPLADIRSVTVGVGTDAVVRVNRGAPASHPEAAHTELTLRFDGRSPKEKRDAFVERLQKSLDERTDVPVAAMLDAGGRERRVWLDDLRRLGGDNYRGGGLPTEELWRVVEHVSAPPAARVGALAMLVSRLDDEGRVRLSVLAEGTVKPEVRAALETATESDATDERVLEAFEK